MVPSGTVSNDWKLKRAEILFELTEDGTKSEVIVLKDWEIHWIGEVWI